MENKYLNTEQVSNTFLKQQQHSEDGLQEQDTIEIQETYWWTCLDRKQRQAIQ